MRLPCQSCVLDQVLLEQDFFPAMIERLREYCPYFRHSQLLSRLCIQLGALPRIVVQHKAICCPLRCMLERLPIREMVDPSIQFRACPSGVSYPSVVDTLLLEEMAITIPS